MPHTAAPSASCLHAGKTLTNAHLLLPAVAAASFVFLGAGLCHWNPDGSKGLPA
jgi:hypothetical protein